MNGDKFRILLGIALSAIGRYLISVGDACSQLLNALVFISLNANESLSGRCWRLKEHWFYGSIRYIIDFVFKLFKNHNHCYNAYANDIVRAKELLKHNVMDLEDKEAEADPDWVA